ncbi:aryl-sulfate sulfotransferase [Planctomicrobium piriforme]|uniref:Arylsulfotransferase (ASST) n=1 Tax=Planctomicrobium piriforme TaxID=1576369 RepID=A0A1I3B6T3_9PLAN|nr:aryl-sulfate sulfotransferase [Planctomicrobium piriforme]SFH57411.1 Arylsulfotransferase (ASST) [Planctomicrobium piriforme]
MKKRYLFPAVIGVLALSAGLFAWWWNHNPHKIPDGLSISKPQAFAGYSLLAPMSLNTTWLVDMEGRIVNEWKSDYPPALSVYLLENGHLLRPCNDSKERSSHDVPGTGGRIQEFDWNGELVWDFHLESERYRPHHDICRLPNGNILMIATDKKTDHEAVAAGRHPITVTVELKPDAIIEVKPTGKTTGEIVWAWHAFDHLVQEYDNTKPNYGDIAAHPELIDVNFSANRMDSMMLDPRQLSQLQSLGYVGASKKPAPKRLMDGKGFTNGDWMHTNSVTYNADLDQIMISLFEFSEVWVIDHSTTTVEAAGHTGGRYGKGGDLLYRWGNPKTYHAGDVTHQRLFSQHSAHWIPAGLPGAGHMLVFNNGLGRPGIPYSTVDEIELPVQADGSYALEPGEAFGPDAACWSYAAAEPFSFYSMLVSGAQRLPNGNTFICSGKDGVVFEATPENEVVWRYKLPGMIDPEKLPKGPPPPPPPGTKPGQRPVPIGPGGLFRCNKYAPDYAAFTDKDLKPREPLGTAVAREVAALKGAASKPDP